jgi:hypothetical protein
MGVGKVEIRIGELVLDGVLHADGQRAGEAVKHELARLVRERGAEQLSGMRSSTAALSAPSFAMSPAAGPRAVGKAVARSVHSALTARAGKR